MPSGSGLHPVDFPAMTAELAAAVYTYLARAPSKLLLVQMEDGFGGREQPNLPGTLQSAYPCWRLKLPANLEEWRASPTWRASCSRCAGSGRCSRGRAARRRPGCAHGSRGPPTGCR